MPEIDVAVTVVYVAWDTGNLVGKTGDDGNHTLRGVSDVTEFTPGNSPAEIDSTNLPGLYRLTLTSGENDGAMMTLGGKSSTTDIVIIPVSWTNKVNTTQIEGADATDQINAQVDAALADIDLDHLIQTDAGAEEPTDGAYLDQIMHKGAGQGFDATTDSLEAIRDTMSSSSITTVAAVSGSDITVVPYTTWEFTIDGLADLSDAAANGVYFTVKRKASDADSAAILQVQEGVGLIVLNGSDSVTANKASVTVDAGEDEIVVHVNASQTGITEQRGLVWDIKKVITATEDADQMATGAFHIGDEAITRVNTVA
jgi:hypothetical protein